MNEQNKKTLAHTENGKQMATRRTMRYGFFEYFSALNEVVMETQPSEGKEDEKIAPSLMKCLFN